LIGKIMGGNPAFRGTRVPVHMLAELVPAHSGDCDRPFRPKVITDSGDRDHAVTRPIGSA
jgi:hypothetical protein